MKLPRITPIHPILMRNPFDDPDWIFEPKFDGFRGILYIDGDESCFRSKKDRPLIAFRELATKIRRELKVTSAIIDGEIAILNPNTGYSDFNALMRRKGPAVYMAFDLLWIGGNNLTAESLMECKQKLRALIREEGWARLVPYLADHGKKFMDQIVAAELEGMIAKQKMGVYTPQTRWMKIYNPNLKNERQQRAKRFGRFRNK